MEKKTEKVLAKFETHDAVQKEKKVRGIFPADVVRPEERSVVSHEYVAERRDDKRTLGAKGFGLDGKRLHGESEAKERFFTDDEGFVWDTEPTPNKQTVNVRAQNAGTFGGPQLGERGAIPSFPKNVETKVVTENVHRELQQAERARPKTLLRRLWGFLLYAGNPGRKSGDECRSLAQSARLYP